MGAHGCHLWMFRVFCCGCGLFWGAQGWPLGSYWWDELALSGAVRAIQNGSTPTVDFWAPFILPLYLKLLAQALVGVAGEYVVECLLQGTVTLLLLAVLLGRRRHGASVYLVGIWVVAMATMPFNLGSVAEAQVGSVAFAGSYNRFGSALIGLALLLPCARSGVTRDQLLAVWLAVVFTLAFFTKITSFQVAYAACLMHAIFCGDAGFRHLLMRATLLAVLVSVLVLQCFDGGGGYLSALRDMSELRLISMRERLDTYRMVLAAHRLELFVMLLLALLVAVRSTLLNLQWAGCVTSYLVSMALITLYTLTNFGDNGLAPAVVAMHGLLFIQAQKEAGASAVVPGWSRYVALLRRGSLCMGAVTGAAYIAFHGYYLLMFIGGHADKRIVNVPASTAFFAQNLTVDELAWRERTPIHVSGVVVNERSARAYAAYVAGLDEAAVYLVKNLPDRDKSVYALDFPAYVFSLVEGYRVPKHSYPWLLYGHELTIDFHPAATALLSDVDILMVSKCSIAPGNRKHLAMIYRLEIESNWRKQVSLTCWDVYARK
jgi:hypothetical protein